MRLSNQQPTIEALRRAEERLRLAQEAAHAGTWEWDAHTRQLSWSEVSERLHGLAPGSFAGTFEAGMALVHPDDRDTTRKAVEALFECGHSEAEYRIVRADGTERWIAWSGRTAASAPGEPQRAVGVYVDVTERRLAEAALRESESRFREVANSAPVLMFTTDEKGDCTFVNDRWAEFTGLEPERALGRMWLKLLHPDDSAHLRAVFEQALCDHLPFEVEYRLRSSTGEYCWVLARSAPVIRGTEFHGFIGSLFDITGRRRAEASMRLLAELAGALAAARHPESAMEALASSAVPLFADWCVVASPDRATGGTRRVAYKHADAGGQQVLDEWAAYLRESGTADLVVQGAFDSQAPQLDPLVGPDWHEGDGDERQLDLLAKLRPRSHISVPLEARGRTFGIATFTRTEGRSRFDEADLGLAEDLGRRTALAIGNLTLALEAEQREEDLRAANAALQFLADAGIELSSSLEPSEALQRMANMAVPAIADICIVDVLNAQKRVVRGAVAARDERLASHTLGFSLPQGASKGSDALMERLAQGLSVFAPRVTPQALEALAHNPEHLAHLREMNPRSAIIVPLLARGQVLGAITLVRTQGSAFTENDLATAEQLGRRAGLSVDNVRLYTESRRIEDDLRRRNEFMQFLADASTEMASTLDYTEALAKLAHLAVPRVADWCAVDVLAEPERLERVTVVHKDPKMVRFAVELQRRYPIDLSSPTGVAHVLRTGRAALYKEIPRKLLEQLPVDQEYRDVLLRAGMHSAMIVPLYSSGRVFGAITFVMSEGEHHFDDDDLEMAKEIGRRAGVWVENARLYTEAQEREAELRRANEAKDEFLGMMSHELRTPITVIHGGAQVLRSRSATIDEETRGSLLSDIERESERLARMLENLLAMARVELDQEPCVEPVLVQRLCERVIDARSAKPISHPLDLKLEAGLPPVAAEPSYLEHVIRNLLSNAEKYSPAGRPVDLEVQRAQDGSVMVRVLDRGFGIGAHEATRIFERFYRSDRTAKVASGAGMGLAVCKRLIEAMSGQIWARPREGGGLEVGFCLPVYEESEE